MKCVRALVLIPGLVMMPCLSAVAQSEAPPATLTPPATRQTQPSAPPAAPAQETSPSASVGTQTIPAVTADPIKDPESYLKQVAATMLQRAPGNPPFHVKATFKALGVMDANASGTYEETWIFPGKWRMEIQYGSFHMLQISRGAHVYRSASDSFTPRRVREAMAAIVPSLGIREYSNEQWKTSKVELKKVPLTRIASVTTSWNKGERPIPEDADYFLLGTDDLVMRARNDSLTVFATNGVLAGKRVPLDSKISEGKYLTEELHIEDLTANPTSSETDFIPPSSATEAPDYWPVRIEQKVMYAQRTGGADPIYPPEAKQKNLSGTVLLAVSIDTSGVVHDMDILDSSGSIFNNAACASVKTWRYTPTQINGKTVSVDTQVTVRFLMH